MPRMSIILRFAGVRTLACSLLVAFLPASAAAQSLGGKGGVTLSSVQLDDEYAGDGSPEAGFVAGGYVGYRLRWGLGLRAEALFAEEHATVNGIQDDRFRYFDVPVLVSYAIGSRLNVMAGAVPRWLLSADETIAGETSSLKEGVAHGDLAIAVGAAFDLRWNLAADVRYLWGNEEIYRRVDRANEGLWRSWQVTVAYALRR